MQKAGQHIPEFARLTPLEYLPDRLIGRDKFSPYAVFVPFLWIESETHWLFEKRSASIRQGGEICFPGGGVERKAYEHPREAALRETAEELGITQDKINLEGYLGHLVTHWGGVIDVFYGTVSCGLQEISPKTNEVAEVFSVPLRYFTETPPATYHFQQVIQPGLQDSEGKPQNLPWKELGLPSRYSKPRAVRTYPVHFYQYKGNTIWGLTADIIKELLELLNFQNNGVH